MKIISLQAENIKKIKAVEIHPDGKAVVVISGRNGQGKTSVLDSLWYALAGTANLPSQPIRRGQEKAFIRLDLGEIVVTRKFTAAGTALTVEAASGARFPSPQRMLDELLGTLTFDPLAFLRQAPKQQLETLRGLVKLDVDVDKLRSEAQKIFDERTILNREVKGLEAQALAIVVPGGTPDDELDVMALVAQLNEAGKKNAEREKRKAGRETVRAKVATEKARIETKRVELDGIDEWLAGEIARINKQAEESKASIAAQIATSVELVRDAEAKLTNADPLPDPIDTALLEQAIGEGQQINTAVRAKQRQKKLREDLQQKREMVENATEKIDLLQKTMRDAITSAEMPVPGLSFGDGEVLYEGLPLAQASDAEQLQISAAIAMGGNPKLRVLRIRDGSLLDEDSLARLESMAELADYQIWLEKVDSSGKVGVVIEDGEIVEKGEHATA
jgi:DNA repair exonuclease SbcCD ATPase subunit